jgi:tetraacyldisaccharide 4'-kinase
MNGLWRDEANLALRAVRAALTPLELSYTAGAAAHRAAYRRGWRRTARAGCPVISIGNLRVGGAGKTPVAAWLARWLRERGERPALLHGGYADDEPRLHAHWNPDVPVYTGRDRSASGVRALTEGATVLVLDDGFQHYALARDLDIALVPAESWHEHPHLLPAGAWREPPRALARADAVAITRRTSTAATAVHVLHEALRYSPLAFGLVFALHARGWRRWGAPHTERSAVAPQARVLVAGVAEPQSFAELARANGADTDVHLFFRDHHAYSSSDAARIRATARGQAVLTTEKDALKLAAVAPDLDVWVLDLEVVLERGVGELTRSLDKVLS